MFLPEHSHIPAARESHFDPDRGDLPEEYWRTLDPFVALAAAAQLTTTLKLGTGICLVVQRDPIHLAKSVASLDFISNGRFLFGIGGGWNREEMQNHGTDPRRRFALMKERVLAMKEIWSEPEASFSGDFVEFDRILAYPKPVQRPHPPILIGGTGPTAIDRVLGYGDEWLPEPSPNLLERIAELFARAKETGREGEVGVTLYSAELESVSEFERAGVGRCVFFLPARDRKRTLMALDELATALKLG